MPLPPEYLRQITREEMNALPIRRYEGEVHLLESPQALERAAADILREAVVGFDTETRPAFRKGESHLPSLAQVATGRAVYLFPLQRVDCSGVLGALLGAPHVVAAGVALADDLRQLRQLFEFEVAAALDLGQVARRHGLKQTGLRNLTGIFLGTRIPKGTKTTNWAAPRLSPQQVTYAATDAWACRELYLRFQGLGLL
ncbi:MAG TPA: 3'-5' exonuclease [Burkholderiales bacterium]|nr:3'-5' exonuclease [Burkholderiales bacterium]